MMLVCVKIQIIIQAKYENTLPFCIVFHLDDFYVVRIYNVNVHVD